eukprot:2361780-Amphidinium_carterae.1
MPGLPWRCPTRPSGHLAHGSSWGPNACCDSAASTARAWVSTASHMRPNMHSPDSDDDGTVQKCKGCQESGKNG